MKEFIVMPLFRQNSSFHGEPSVIQFKLRCFVQNYQLEKLPWCFQKMSKLSYTALCTSVHIALAFGKIAQMV